MNIIAIVGRPNVGKSTLFNRIIGRRHAIIEEEPGVTRDRLYAEAEWAGVFFTLIDTGGILPHSEDVIDRAIREQAFIAMEEADSIIFVVDSRGGLTAMDEDLARELQRSGKHITLAVNKVDNEKHENQIYEFSSLGLGDPFGFSALSGRSLGDLLDHAVIPLRDRPEPPEDTRLKIAVVGRPNAGKSSLVNALLGEERNIVTPVAGTTRDAIDSVVKYHGQEIVLIDTAGLRRRSRVKENVEMYSVIRTSRAIDRCDVAVVLIDAEFGLEAQDKRILNDVADARKGLILAINKWDLIEKTDRTADERRKEMLEDIPTLDYVVTSFISALTRQRIHKIIDLALEVQERREHRIATHELNTNLLAEIAKNPPPSVRGRDLRINYITQVSTAPPVFAFFLNHPELLPDAYKRFLERRLREMYDLRGVPISFVFRRKSPKRED